jgi:hypothetical protein
MVEQGHKVTMRGEVGQWLGERWSMVMRRGGYNGRRRGGSMVRRRGGTNGRRRGGSMVRRRGGSMVRTRGGTNSRRRGGSVVMGEVAEWSGGEVTPIVGGEVAQWLVYRQDSNMVLSSSPVTNNNVWFIIGRIAIM